MKLDNKDKQEIGDYLEKLANKNISYEKGIKQASKEFGLTTKQVKDIYDEAQE